MPLVGFQEDRFLYGFSSLKGRATYRVGVEWEEELGMFGSVLPALGMEMLEQSTLQGPSPCAAPTGGAVQIQDHWDWVEGWPGSGTQ